MSRNLLLSKKIAIFLIVLAGLLVGARNVEGAIRTSTATGGTWTTGSTWVGGIAPAAGDDAIIVSGATVTLGANASITNVTVNSGGTLSILTRTLTITGNWTNNGTISGTTGRLDATTGTFTNNGAINLSTGRIIQTTGSLTNSATGTITFSGAGTITFGTGNFINLNSSTNVNFGSSAITISGTAVAQTIGGFRTTGTVSCTKTSGTATFTGNVSGGALSKSGNGALDLGTGFTHTFSGTWTRTAGSINCNSSILRIGGSVSGTGGTFIAGTGTVDWYRSGTQTCAVLIYYNLTLSGTSAKTFATTPTVEGVLSLEGTATATVTTGVVTYGANATLQYNTPTARTTSNETWISPFVASGGLIITNTGAITLNASKTASVPLRITDGATLNLSTFTLGNPTLTMECGGVTGSLISGSGTLTLGGNITIIDDGAGSAGATISCPIALGASRIFTVANDGTAAADLTISGIISGSTYGLTKDGPGTLVLSGLNSYGGATTISTGTLQFGANNTLSTVPVVLNGGTLSTGATTGYSDAVGTLNLSSSSTISLGTGSHTITFANSSGVTWVGSSLTINGWTGTAGESNTSGGKIFVGVGGLDATQLAKISFSGYTGTPIILPSGELVPPATTLANDYFRSKTTGNWSATSTWESSPDGISWINATLTPTSAANTITIRTGHTVSVNSSLSVDQIVIDNGGTVGINNGQTLTLADGSGTDLAVNGSLIVSGTFISSGTVTTSGTVTFNSGSTYEHDQNGGTIPNASWNAASTCLVTGITTTGPAGLNQTFGNLTWNCVSQTGNTTPAGDITIQGNFVLSNGAFTLSDGPARNMFIGGNYTQTNGLFDFNVGTSGTFLTKMYVGGNFLNTASATESMSTVGNGRYNGEIVFNGSGTQTLSFSNPAAARWISFTIEPSSTVQLLSDFQLYGDNGNPQYYANFTVNGTLDAGSFSITDGVPQTNATVVVVNSGANFITANSSGISGTFPSATTTKTFSSGANYEFEGATTGTFVTTPNANTVNNLIVNRSAGVTLSQNIAVAGNLIFTSGNLISTTSNLLSITNTSTSAISGASSSSFINGPVKWTLPSSLGSGSTYIFPTGTGSGYLPFSLVNPTTGTGTVTAQVEAFAVNAGGSFDATLESISTTEYWSLATTGNFTNSSISLDRGISNDPLDVIGGSVSVAGTYTSLEGTPGATGVSGSDPIGTYRYFVLAEKKKTTIATGSIGTPFCAGSSVSVPFTITGIYTSGNVFTAQLSNASGSFSSPVNIGTLTSVTAGTITGIIPVATAAGTGYRIRVVSNLPAATGGDNGSDLTVTAQVIANVTIAANQNNVCSGTSVSFTATPTNGGTTPSYQWKVNGNNAGTNSASYSYVPLNSDIVTCVLTSNANCVTGSPATSNAITMTVNPLPATGEIVGD